jgi:hypothetical protein
MISSCEDDNSNEVDLIKSNAILGNYDLALCACCGGYIIFLENDSSSYRFETLPETSNIILPNEGLEVSITYEVDRVCAEITYLFITKIEER